MQTFKLIFLRRILLADRLELDCIAQLASPNSSSTCVNTGSLSMYASRRNSPVFFSPFQIPEKFARRSAKFRICFRWLSEILNHTSAGARNDGRLPG